MGSSVAHGPVARVDGMEISPQEFEAALLKKYQSPARVDTLSPTEKRRVLEELIEQKLIYLEALSLQLDRRPLIQEKLRSFRETMLIDKLIEKNVVDSILTERRLRKFYRVYGGEIRLRQIYLPATSTAYRQAANRKNDVDHTFQSIQAHLAAGADFAELAKLYSRDARTSSRGGDTGWVRWGQLPKEVQEVAFHLSLHQISKPIRSGFGYYIIQLTGRHKRPFDQEKRTLQYQLAAIYARTINDARESFYFRLSRKYGARLHEAAINWLADHIGPNFAPWRGLKKEARRKVLASAAGISVTIQDLIAHLGDRAPRYHWTATTIRKFVREMLRRQITLAEAKKQGISAESETRKFLEEQLVQYLKDLKKKTVPLPTEAELREYFRRHAELFQIPERVRVREIYVEDVLLVEKIMKWLRNGQDFVELVRKYTSRTSNEHHDGDLGWFTARQRPNLFDAAQQIEVGQIAGPIAVPGGFSIIQLLKRQEAGELSFAEAESIVKKYALQEKRQRALRAWVDSLKQKREVQILATL